MDHSARITAFTGLVGPPGQTRTEAEAWITWAVATAERLDQLNTPPRMPDIPEPRADDLKPFLGHWSPYGP
ncbi:hypothetical protein [Streptomyces sp. NBC_01601]|uniref:hypothetical protein n=1 Tax=Streptomyces sp. NBC_01601 TaxID=2975892 RepID=UPI002E2D4FA8|nr:hypothetical protein [Streptomyces sp. NBC_01601]